MAKLTSKTNFNTTPAAIDVMHVVDVSDTTDDPNGSSFKLEVVDLLQRPMARFIEIRIIEGDTDDLTGTGLGHEFRMPFAGTFLQDDATPEKFSAYVNIAGITGTMIVDVNKNGTTIMTTNKLQIETTEKSSATAITQPDLTTTAFAAGDIITIDIDTAQTTKAKGLTVRLWVQETY